MKKLYFLFFCLVHLNTFAQQYKEKHPEWFNENIYILDNKYIDKTKSFEEAVKKYEQVVALIICKQPSQEEWSKICTFKNIKRLCFSCYGKERITQIPISIFKNLTNLECLQINGQLIRTIPTEIGQLQKLKVIDLQYCKKIILPKEIIELKKIEYISFKYCELSNLQEELFYLSNLEVLDLYHNPNIIVSTEIKKLKNLKMLDLGDCSLQVLPNEIGDLSNLESLNIGMNNISMLPETICKLTKLKNLTIHYNSYLTIPICISELKKLEYLGIVGCSITENEKKQLKKKLRNTKIE